MINRNTFLLNIRTFILGIVLASTISCNNNPHTSERAEANKIRPNVLFILVDDLGYHDLGITGSEYYETPNIDRIAREGTVFTQGYAASRVCSPSRASIMTGKFTATHGITDWIGAKSGENWRQQNRNDRLLPADYRHDLPKEDLVLAENMKQEGYSTFFAGKWHLGGEGSHPTDHGFTINKGGWDVGSPRGGYYSPWTNPFLENNIPGENLSMRLAVETADFITENKDSSFFAFLSFYAVHGPIQTTEKKWKKYRDKAESQGISDTGFVMERVLPIRVVQDNPVYAGLVESTDQAIGHVLKTLDELGLQENTIIIFTSDNGGVASGDAFSTSNLPLRGGKGYQWEGGIREPYFIKVPWIKDVKTVDYPVTGADFYPTILDFAGIPLVKDQHTDGKSLAPLMRGKSLPSRSLFWHYPHYGNQGGEPSSIIRENDWKLIHYYEDGRNELYDLKNDPAEQEDLSAIDRNITKLMYEKLMAYLNSVNANMPRVDMQFDSELAIKNKKNKIEKLLPGKEAERLNYLDKNYLPNENWWDSKVTKD